MKKEAIKGTEEPFQIVWEENKKVQKYEKGSSIVES